jgi:hypothetical protein
MESLSNYATHQVLPFQTRAPNRFDFHISNLIPHNFKDHRHSGLQMIRVVAVERPKTGVVKYHPKDGITP